MKKTLPLLAVFSLLITSCTKQFIEILPVDTVTVDVLYKTDKDYQDAVIGVYSIYQDQYQNMYYFGDIRGDDVWDELVKGTAGAVDNFTLANDDALLINTWRNYYKAITRANTLLEKIASTMSKLLLTKIGIPAKLNSSVRLLILTWSGYSGMCLPLQRRSVLTIPIKPRAKKSIKFMMKSS